MPVAIDYSQVLFDAQGKPYWRKADGSKAYIPPLVAMQSNNPRAVEWARQMGVYTNASGQVVNRSAPGQSLFKERGHWDPDRGEWDQDVNMNTIVSMGVGGAMAAPYVAGALAGSGGAQGATGAAGASANSGTLASSSIPGLHAAVPGAVTSQGVSASLGGAMPLASAASRAANGAGGAGEAAGVGGRLRELFTDPDNLAGLAGVIAGLASGNGGQAESEEARRMNAITEQRMRRVDPLHQAVTQLAWGRLPINARNGIAAPQIRPLE